MMTLIYVLYILQTIAFSLLSGFLYDMLDLPSFIKIIIPIFIFYATNKILLFATAGKISGKEKTGLKEDEKTQKSRDGLREP